MKLDKRVVGLLAGILACALVWVVPLDGLAPISAAGQHCLALTLMTVVWWATGVAQPAYVSAVYLALLILTGTADTGTVFASWTKMQMWMVIGAYLIAAAVKDSGLGERIAYWFALKFVRGWTSLVVSIFALTFILSLLIPHPFPRAFMILAVMLVICDAAKMSRADKIKVGFLVFAAAAPGSMFFLTGDATLNPLVASYAADGCSFIQWFVYMSVPMLVATLCTLGLGLVLFRPETQMRIDFDEVRTKQAALGRVGSKEKRTVVWLVIAIALWLTESMTGLNIGFVTLLVGAVLALPVIGEVITPATWNSVPINTLVFLTAAMGIGTVGEATGMNAWIASVVLPDSVPGNALVLALLIAGITVIIHMFMGSVMAVLGICVPAFIAFTAGSGVSDIAVAMMVFSAINIHYILPFHNLAILVGEGEDNAGYSSKEAVRMGTPLTAVVFVVVLVEAVWFRLLGLM
ncbi:SLC13 family permease [Actinomyces glycerinitolerans]|uniref:Sodium-dependent dicarboxylate transporter SdcS n=1 Tax=Actinomyces glycerinitolerans TaxID=1892869 RepID=A0A1M4RXT6_9ACTO|nr:SLC13 family permease [Actinomyces glycerinitolerans]SHE24768.1 sodium/sulphate symporter [Actinomyces glycerinitolerans]